MRYNFIPSNSHLSTDLDDETKAIVVINDILNKLENIGVDVRYPRFRFNMALENLSKDIILPAPDKKEFVSSFSIDKFFQELVNKTGLSMVVLESCQLPKIDFKGNYSNKKGNLNLIGFKKFLNGKGDDVIIIGESKNNYWDFTLTTPKIIPRLLGSSVKINPLLLINCRSVSTLQNYIYLNLKDKLVAKKALESINFNQVIFRITLRYITRLYSHMSQLEDIVLKRIYLLSFLKQYSLFSTNKIVLFTNRFKIMHKATSAQEINEVATQSFVDSLIAKTMSSELKFLKTMGNSHSPLNEDEKLIIKIKSDIIRSVNNYGDYFSYLVTRGCYSDSYKIKFLSNCLKYENKVKLFMNQIFLDIIN